MSLRELPDPTANLVPERTVDETFEGPRFPHADPTLGQDIGRAASHTLIYKAVKKAVYDLPQFFVNAAYYDKDYDWRNDADTASGRYPADIFDHVHSRREAEQSMRDYDAYRWSREAANVRPVTNFLLNGLGFAADVVTVRAICPFIGGIPGRVGRAAAGAIEAPSILTAAVESSTALMTEVAGIEITRTMADDYETLGENAGSIAMNTALAGLLGGAIGGFSKWRALEKAEAMDGLKAANEAHLKQKFSEDFKTATDITDDSIGKNRVPEDRPATSDEVIGKMPKEEGASVFKRASMRKWALSAVMKLNTSPNPVFRWIGRNLADSKVLLEGVDGKSAQAVDVLARIDRNRLLNRQQKAVSNAFKKMQQDKKPLYAKIKRRDFNEQVTQAIRGEGVAPNPYAAEAAQNLKPLIEEMYDLHKKADLGDMREHWEEYYTRLANEKKGHINRMEKYRERLGPETVEQRIETKLRREMHESRAAGETRDIGKTFRTAERMKNAANKVIESVEEASQGVDLELQKSGEFFDTFQKTPWTELEEEIMQAMDSKISTARERLQLKNANDEFKAIYKDMVFEASKGAKANARAGVKMDRSLARLKKALETQRNRVAQNYAREMNSAIRHRSRMEAKFRAQETARSGRFTEQMDRYSKEMADIQEAIERVKQGKLTDEEWGTVKGEGYIHRAYDIAYLESNAVEFVAIVRRWLEKDYGLKSDVALTQAQNIKDDILGNSYKRVPDAVRVKVGPRGMERQRLLQIPSKEIQQFLVNDVDALFYRMANTIYPDYHIKMRFGTTNPDALVANGTDWYNGEVQAGRMTSSQMQKAVKADTESVRALWARIRGINEYSGNALWRSKGVRSVLNFSRSMTSAIMLGGLPSTALYDIASVLMMNGPVGLIRHYVPSLTRFLGKLKLSEATKAEIESLGLFTEVNLAENVGRMTDFFQDQSFGTKLERAGHSLRNATMKASGANYILSRTKNGTAHGITLRLKSIAEKVSKGEKLTLDESQFVNIGRLSEDSLRRIHGQINEFAINDGGLQLMNPDGWADAAVRQDFLYAVNNLLDASIFNPGLEVPGWASQDPLLACLFQFKAFMFTAYDRCLMSSMQKMAAGNYHMADRILGMVCLAGFRECLNCAVDGREQPSPTQFLVQGIANADVLPWIGNMLKVGYEGFSNDDLLPSVGDGLYDFFIPPAARVAQNMAYAGNGVLKLMNGEERPTKREARALKQSFLMNGHYLFRRALREWTESLAEK